MAAETIFFVFLVILAAAGIRLARRYGTTAVTAAILVPYILYLSMVIPGILGVLKPGLVILCLVLMGGPLVWAGFRGAAVAHRPGPDGPPLRLTRRGYLAVLPLTGLAALAATVPYSWWSNILFHTTLPEISLSRMVSRWFRRMIGTANFSFDWDTASYHLPGLMEFLQNKTLWSFEGPYQSYSYGFELITGFSVMMRGMLSVLAGNMLGLLVAVAVGMLAVRSIGAALITRRLGWLYAASLTVVLAGITQDVATHPLDQLGKNDMFTGACLLAALGLLLHGLTMAEPDTGADAAPGAGRVLTLVASATALALAVASKPNSLAYVPLWAASLGLVLWKRPLTMRQTVALLAAAAAVMVSGLLFSIRNLVVFGRLTGNITFTAWDKTIASALLEGTTHGALGADDSLVLIWLCLCTVLMLTLPVMARGARRWAAVLSAVWFLYGLLVFTITPFSLFPGSVSGENVVPPLIQWRLAILAFLVAGVGITAGIDRIFAAVFTAFQADLTAPGAPAALRPIRRFPYWAAPMAALSVFVVVHHHQRGMPAPQQTVPVPHDLVYDWVAALPSPLRIYSSGLRPYGLYGRKIKHHLFYDLNAGALDDLAYAQKRLIRIRQDFRPDLVILGNDRGKPGVKQPVVGWLAQQPCVEEVFTTVDVSAFRLQPGCTAPWGDGVPLDGPLHMGS